MGATTRILEKALRGLRSFAYGAEGRRPRIGLALGGGFARGIAHLGVLRILEQNEIPIDCIAGTSVGGLIGAAYASGTTIDQLAREASSTVSPRRENSRK